MYVVGRKAIQTGIPNLDLDSFIIILGFQLCVDFGSSSIVTLYVYCRITATLCSPSQSLSVSSQLR